LEQELRDAENLIAEGRRPTLLARAADALAEAESTLIRKLEQAGADHRLILTDLAEELEARADNARTVGNHGEAAIAYEDSASLIRAKVKGGD